MSRNHASPPLIHVSFSPATRHVARVAVGNKRPSSFPYHLDPTRPSPTTHAPPPASDPAGRRKPMADRSRGCVAAGVVEMQAACLRDTACRAGRGGGRTALVGRAASCAAVNHGPAAAAAAAAAGGVAPGSASSLLTPARLQDQASILLGRHGLVWVPRGGMVGGYKDGVGVVVLVVTVGGEQHLLLVLCCAGDWTGLDTVPDSATTLCYVL